MTASAEQERALADLRHLYAQMVGGLVKDSAQAKRIADGILSRAIQKLEQAARRAPVMPVPQGLFEAIEHGDEKHRAWLKAALTAFFAGKPIPREVAAAPQPPEAAQSNSAEFDGIKTKAAPVQLPEYDIDTANHAGVRVRGYTKQQVRELLATHGIEEQQ